MMQERYQIGRVVGSGSSSVVHVASRRCDGREFACKISGGTEATLQESVDEIEIMKLLGNHDSIASCRDAFFTRDTETTTSYIVTDLMKGSDMGAALGERGSFSEEDARIIISQLLRAVVHMHDLGVVHRDIKLENILLPSDVDCTDIKLCDFGFATSGCPSTGSNLTQRCGTPMYVAPEIIGERNVLYGNKVDVWSSGVVLFMLLSGYPPFIGNDMTELLNRILRSGPDFGDPAWNLVSPDARDIVEKLLAKDPKKRPSAREALLHPWLSQ